LPLGQAAPIRLSASTACCSIRKNNSYAPVAIMQANLIPNRQPHILVIDDEESDLRMLHTVLSKKYHCDDADE
jgi:hypothetical protein